MEKEERITKIINQIVKKAEFLIKKKISEPLIIDFVDIFPKNELEREELTKEIKCIGKGISKTETGEIYVLKKPISTEFGNLSLIKIRIFDPTRKQKGAPDFKVKDYLKFKKEHLKDKDFKLIIRKNYEMLELNGKDVLIYFPNQTLGESLGIKFY